MDNETEIARIADTLSDAERDGLAGVVRSRSYHPPYEVWVSLEDLGLIATGSRPDLVDATLLGRSVWQVLFVPPKVREANAAFARNYHQTKAMRSW